MNPDRRKFLRQFLAGSAAGALSLHGFGQPQDAPQGVDWGLSGKLEGEEKWAEVRRQFRFQANMAWFNTGTLGLMPEPVMHKIAESMAALQTGSYNTPKDVRTTVAHLLNAQENEIALTHNTTSGINIVAQGLPLRAGDEVIVSDQEHVGNAVPWLARAQRDRLRLRVLEPGPDATTTLLRLDALISRKTKVIALPHITCTTGQVLPIAEINRRYADRVPYILFDGAHGPGTTAVDVAALGCGFYASCGHKWLCGPAGTGFLYVRQDLLETLRPIFVGAGSDSKWEISAYRQELEGWAEGAARFEPGTQNRALKEGMQAAIQFMEQVGWADIHARVRVLAGRLRAGLEKLDWLEILTPAEEASSAAILTFRTRDPLRRLSFVQSLQAARRFRVREVRESGLDAVRISTHLFNTLDEVDALAEWIQGWKE